MAGVADGVFSAQFPCVVGANEPVLPALPDDAYACPLEVSVVFTAGVSSVSIDPHAAVFCVEGELELLVVSFYGDEPAVFSSGDVAAVAGASLVEYAFTPQGPPREKCSEESRGVKAYWP